MSALFLKRAFKLVRWTLTLQLPTRLRERRVVRALHDSGLFDAHYYVASHPDVAESGLDPISHYVRYGAAEGRDPSPLFDTEHYGAERPDIAESGMNPLLHYVLHGAAEGRDPSPLFDTAYYAAQAADLQPGQNPLRHYLEQGAAAGLRTHPLFDPLWYRQHYPEVAEAGLDPLIHYLQHAHYRRVARADARRADPAATDSHSTFSSNGESLPTAPSRAGDVAAAGEPPRLIAFFLPQYHPIPENDEWWGEGFTDWTNVTRAEPLYPGHHQPRLPADLGFYDLRIPEVRSRQAAMAAAHGIDGFCYYYYWFEGRRVLERPLTEILESGEPDFPFCICWANENWTRRWDGQEDDILLEQNHSLPSDLAFIEEVLPLFQDPRYITVDGAPLLLIYRPDKLKDPQETAALWRDVCTRAGLPGLHLCAVQFRSADPRPLGFDSAVEFPPHHFPAPRCPPEAVGASPDFEGSILDYRTGAANALLRSDPDYVLYRGVVPSWDNTARRKKAATIYYGASPEAYAHWLDGLVERAVRNPSPSSRFLFINAWNEWAEGAYLEPDRKHGTAFLEATRRVMERYREPAKDEWDSARSATLESARPGLADVARGRSGARALPDLPALPAPLRWKSPGRDAGATEARRAKRTPLLFVAHDAAAAGAQLVLIELLEALRKRDEFDLHVVLLGDGVLLPRYEAVAHTLRLDAAASGRHADDPSGVEQAISTVAAELRGRGCEFAVCNTVVTAEAARACKDAGLAVISLVHEQPDSIDKLFGGAETIERLDRASDAMVAVSRFASTAIEQRYGIDAAKLEIIHPPRRTLSEPRLSRDEARAEFFGTSKAEAASALIVLGCGTLYPRKGPDLFIELARRAKEAIGNERIRFVWVGGALTEHGVRDHVRMAKSAGVSDVLSFTGAQDDIARYFSMADVFALTSREDPFPLVNLEAMSFGLPTVAFTEAGGAPEIIGADAGVVVPYLDIDAMTEAILALEADRDRLGRLGARARQKIATEFAPDRYAERILDLLERTRTCASR